MLPEYEVMINAYHYGILIFNLLPIYPLDGGKLFHIVFSIFMPYVQSLKLVIIVSYVTIVLMFILNIKDMKLNATIMAIFLLIKVYVEQNQISYIYEKFLLERYLNKYHFKNSKIINNPNHFYRNRHHIIRQNKQYWLEKDYLQKKYQKN